jgi:hypothetical protein
MNTKQTIHIAMINSFNVITGRATIDEILRAGMGIFTYLPDEDVEKKHLTEMIRYFADREMYEHCSELKDFCEQHFPDDIKSDAHCRCELPEIKRYAKMMKCSKCKKLLER